MLSIYVDYVVILGAYSAVYKGIVVVYLRLSVAATISKRRVY